MEEKILIKSEQYNVKKLFKVMIILGTTLSIFIFIVCLFGNMNSYDFWYEEYSEHQKAGSCGWRYESWEQCWICEEFEGTSTKLGFAIANNFKEDLYFIIPIAVLGLIGGLIYLWLRSYELTVTDKRIYGKVAFGKRVDLPVDSISATATIRLLKGVSVSTSSGRISFRIIKNVNEIYKVINNLIIERQQEKSNRADISNTPNCDEADKLKKFKELLDSGVITEEEFDQKKKQLLGL